MGSHSHSLLCLLSPPAPGAQATPRATPLSRQLHNWKVAARHWALPLAWLLHPPCFKPCLGITAQLQHCHCLVAEILTTLPPPTHCRYHVILSADVYFGVRCVLQTVFEPWGMTWEAVDLRDLRAVRAAFARREAAGNADKTLVWAEVWASVKEQADSAKLQSLTPQKRLTGADKPNAAAVRHCSHC